jgi:energy-coupling factor transporter ATP-binding protein EcfA2
MNYQLDDITIHAFRGLRNLTLEKLGRINLIVGANNSGKTSVLEAISTHVQPLDPMEWTSVARRREAIPAREPLITAVEWLFPHDEDASSDSFSSQTAVSSEGGFPVHKTVAQLRAFWSLFEQLPDQGPEEEDSVATLQEVNAELTGARRAVELTLTAELKLDPRFPNAEPEVLRHRALFVEGERYSEPRVRRAPRVSVRHITPFTHWVRSWHVSFLDDAIDSGRKKDLLDLLQQFDIRVRDILIRAPRGLMGSVWIDYAGTGLAPLSAFGDGFRRAFTIASVLWPLRNGVLLIDEIDASLHVSILGRLFRWLTDRCRELNIQVFATTHSLEAVDALLKGQPADGQYDLVGYHLPSEGVQRTFLKRYGGDVLRRMRFESGLDIR